MQEQIEAYLALQTSSFGDRPVHSQITSAGVFYGMQVFHAHLTFQEQPPVDVWVIPTPIPNHYVRQGHQHRTQTTISTAEGAARLHLGTLVTIHLDEIQARTIPFA